MREALSFALCLLPASYVWWEGRRLVRRIDDPAFPELRFARAQRLAFVIAVGVVAGLVVSLQYFWLKLVLAVLGLLVANFPARRSIFGESWGLVAYLSFTLRFYLAALGVWILMLWIPLLIRGSGAAALPVALLLIASVILWGRLNHRIFPLIIGAGRLNDPQLGAAFDEVLKQARCKRPWTLRLDTGGGFWVNALALPSQHQPAVLFSSDLLEALTPDELKAIFAHEVAHLEYFDRRRLFRRELVVLTLHALLLAALLRIGSASAVFGTIVWVWPLAVILLLAAFMAGSQRREHDSDVRAVELTGEPEPLIAGLTRIHNLMRMPRRWRESSEARLSHPSLAHRIRAIRTAAGLVETEGEARAPLETVAVRSATDRREAVVLAGDRLHWLHGLDAEAALDPETLLESARDSRSIRYDELADLRLAVQGIGGRYLKAIDSRGRVMKLPIAGEDVARVKVALERIDLQVRETSPDTAGRLAVELALRRRSRVWASLALLFGFIPPFSFPLIVASVLVLARPLRSTLVAAGLIGLAAGIIGARNPQSLFFGSSSLVLVLIGEVILGALLLWEARARRRKRLDDPAGSWRLAAAVLGGLLLLFLLAGVNRLGAPLPSMQLHLWARYQPGAALVLLGLAGCFASLGSRWASLPAALAAILAAVIIAVGTLGFRNRFGGDMLATGRPAARVASMPLELVRDVDLDARVFQLRLAPSGARIAALVVSYDEEGYDRSGGFEVEMGDGAFVSIDALDLAFLDDDHLAALRYNTAGDLSLQILQLAADPVLVREVVIESVEDPALRLDRTRGRWEIAGAALHDGRASLLSGRLDEPGYKRSDWSLVVAEDAYLTGFEVNAGRRALAVSMSYDFSGLSSVLSALWPLSLYTAPYELWAVGAPDDARLALTTASAWCAEPLPGDADFVCLSSDPEPLTRVWLVDADSENIALVTALTGNYYEAQRSTDGRLLLSGYGLPPALVELSSGRAWVLETGEDSEVETEAEGDWLLNLLFSGERAGAYYEAVAFHGGVVALAVGGGDVAKVRVYRVP